jgi:glycosyltransferase involved in cell wall biosynthesis
MAPRPSVSIVTPSYNQAQYLEATIQSVLAQAYPNLEYMVVDGGSTDGSLEIIQRYADQLAWWVSEPDRGQAEAINKGLKRAKGEVIAWLNSDDVYMPGAIEAAVNALDANPAAGLVYGDLRSIDAQGKQFNTITYQQYTLADLLAFRIIGQPSVFMRRSVLEQTDYLPLDYHFLLDHHLWIQLAALAEMKYIPQAWAAARHHPTAKNVAQASGFGEEAYRILAWAETRPELAGIIQQNPKRIWGGAHRLNARYLLEGDAAWKSLKAYGKAFTRDPSYTLKHWHRILFAVLSLFGLGKLRKLVQRF